MFTMNSWKLKLQNQYHLQQYEEYDIHRDKFDKIYTRLLQNITERNF